MSVGAEFSIFRNNTVIFKRVLTAGSASEIISLIYIDNKSGPRTLSWGAPDPTERLQDKFPHMSTNSFTIKKI